MEHVQRIPIGQIKIDGGYQIRIEGEDQETVIRYAATLQNGQALPPVLVYVIDGQLHLVDGYHRLAAHRRVGIDEIDAIMRVGSHEEAMVAAVAENLKHGLKLSTESKKEGFKTRIMQPGSGWELKSQRLLADLLEVSSSTIGEWLREMEEAGELKVDRTVVLGADNKLRQVTGIQDANALRAERERLAQLREAAEAKQRELQERLRQAEQEGQEANFERAKLLMQLEQAGNELSLTSGQNANMYMAAVGGAQRPDAQFAAGEWVQYHNGIILQRGQIEAVEWVDVEWRYRINGRLYLERECRLDWQAPGKFKVDDWVKSQAGVGQVLAVNWVDGEWCYRILQQGNVWWREDVLEAAAPPSEPIKRPADQVTPPPPPLKPARLMNQQDFERRKVLNYFLSVTSVEEMPKLALDKKRQFRAAISEEIAMLKRIMQMMEEEFERVGG